MHAAPLYPYVEENFQAMASDAMSAANLPGGSYSLGIAPFGVMTGLYPLANNEGAIGHDTLNHCQVPPHNIVLFSREHIAGRAAPNGPSTPLSFSMLSSTVGTSGMRTEDMLCP